MHYITLSLLFNGRPSRDRVFCRLTRPAEKALTIKAAGDLSLVEHYNQTYQAELLPLPLANVEFSNDATISVAAGERISDKIDIAFKADGLAGGTYLLPVVLSSDDATFSEENRVYYYGVMVRNLEPGNYELHTDDFVVFYLNTSKYQPLLADIYLLEKIPRRMDPEWMRTIGNIVNLRVVQIGCDKSTNRAVLVLNSDIRYVLEHADKYIRPLQDKGRKVCLCLEGGSTGLGFCNLSDAQIEDFTAQVKSCIEEYGLDGVNFFDRNAGYGEEGMPQMNTTSYPKLIKAMREALGTEKLVTLADYKAPTEYFWNTEATGGIKVGEYLDYAWSGYMDENEDLQLLDPYGTIDYTNEDFIDEYGFNAYNPSSVYTGKPIAGLEKERYGHYAIPYYSPTSYFISENDRGCMTMCGWRYMGWNPNNIVVFADMRSNEQTQYEGSWTTIPDIPWLYSPENFDGTHRYRIYVKNNTGGLDYNEFEKDW